MRLHCDEDATPRMDGAPSLGTGIGACIIFILVLPVVLFNVRQVPLGSTGGLLIGASLMVAVVTGSQGGYQVVGSDSNLRALFLSLGIMTFSQYFQREGLFTRFAKIILREDISFLHFLFRVTFSTFIISALFSTDTTSLVFTPIVLHIWQNQKRPLTEMETLLLGISTSANLGGVFTVYGSVPVAFIAARTAGLSAENRFDMISACTYLALPALVCYTLNMIILVVFFSIKSKPKLDSSGESVIELQDVEQSLITPNAILDKIIEEEQRVPEKLINRSVSTDCVPTFKFKKKHGALINHHPNSDKFHGSLRLPKFSVGDVNAKGVQAQGSPSLYIGNKLLDDKEEVNKDQCHSLYNLDKIGFIAVSERHNQRELEAGIPRTISFYHSFSDLDSWKYTRDTVVHRFEQDHPRQPIPSLLQRRASSRGRLESVQFKKALLHKLPRQRTSVLYKGLASDALLLSPYLGVYRAFSGLSPGAQFMVGQREDVDNVVNIVNREFVPSNSRFFMIFLAFVFTVMFILFFVKLPRVNLDIGLLPVGAVAVVVLVDAVWNRRNCTLIFRRLNWSVVLNYLALFIFVKGMTNSNVPLWIWSKMNFVAMNCTDVIGIILFLCLVLLFSNIFGSATLTLIILDLPNCSSKLPQLVYLAWCTMVTGNMNLHGSASNLLVSQKAMEIVQCELSYWGYLRYAFLSSIFILVVGVGIIAGLLHAL